MPLSPDDKAEYTADLKEAKAAYKKLIMGQGVASWRDQNGEEVVYNKADIDKLEAYIDKLQDLLGLKDYSGSAPMGVFF